MYKVKKNSGTYESFDKSKIIKNFVKAGASEEDAKKIADEVEKWLPDAAQEYVINSLDIRIRGISILKVIDPKAAKNFESFKKSSDDMVD